MIEKENVKISSMISLSIYKGEIREGSKSSDYQKPIPTLPLRMEGLTDRTDLDIFILSTYCYINIIVCWDKFKLMIIRYNQNAPLKNNFHTALVTMRYVEK